VLILTEGLSAFSFACACTSD